MRKLLLLALLLGASSTALATDNDPAPSGTLSRAECAALSDSFWYATQQLLRPCATKQCIAQREFWRLLRDRSREEFNAGNCTYWTGAAL